MPRIRSALPATERGWTKVPNLLLDRLLPTLKDTELRVLLVLIRGTTGWNREGRSVPLTYRILTLRTGRHTEAVARALRSLESKGLVHVPEGSKRRKAKPSSSRSEGQHKDREG